MGSNSIMMSFTVCSSQVEGISHWGPTCLGVGAGEAALSRATAKPSFVRGKGNELTLPQTHGVLCRCRGQRAPERSNEGKRAHSFHTCPPDGTLAASPRVPLPTPPLSSDSSSFPVQERLRHIGPEEFVQAFVNKDPLEGTKVKDSWKSPGNIGLHLVVAVPGRGE